MHIHQINGIDCKDKEHEWVIELIQNAKKEAAAGSETKMIMICVRWKKNIYRSQCFDTTFTILVVIIVKIIFI